MYIKPKQEKPKRSKKEKPKPSPEHPEYVRVKQMAAIGLEQLSRDWVIEHKKLEILSWDYVTEHGKEFGYELWWDRDYGFFICDRSEDTEDGVYYTGLSYELYQGGSLRYYEHYKDGREDGI